MDGRWSGPSLLARPFFDQVFAGTGAHPAYGFYWWLKKPVPADLAATIDANNAGQFTRQTRLIIDEPRIPQDFVMAAGAYGQRLSVIRSRGLVVVRNGPTSSDDFVDVEFLDPAAGSGGRILMSALGRGSAARRCRARPENVGNLYTRVPVFAGWSGHRFEN
jgi:hypothetical protein